MMIRTTNSNNLLTAVAAVSTMEVDDIVKINIGGKLFLQVFRSTLCLAPDDTMFTQMFLKRNINTNNITNNNTNNNTIVQRLDEEGRIFLDHDPLLMETIINFLRMKKIEDPFDPIVEPPEVAPGKKKDFRRLLNHFGLTAFFFYPSTPPTQTQTPTMFRTTSTRSRIRSMSIDEHEVGVVSIHHNKFNNHDSISVGTEDSTVDGGETVVSIAPQGYDFTYG